MVSFFDKKMLYDVFYAFFSRLRLTIHTFMIINSMFNVRIEMRAFWGFLFIN